MTYFIRLGQLKRSFAIQFGTNIGRAVVIEPAINANIALTRFWPKFGMVTNGIFFRQEAYMHSHYLDLNSIRIVRVFRVWNKLGFRSVVFVCSFPNYLKTVLVERLANNIDFKISVGGEYGCLFEKSEHGNLSTIYNCLGRYFKFNNESSPVKGVC